MKKLLIFIALLIATTSAQEIEVTETIGDIELEINENGIVNVTQNIDLLAHATIYQYDITIPKAKAKTVEISDLNGILEYDSISAGDEEIINFYFSKPLNAGEKRNIKIKYSTEFFTNKQGDTWELSFLLRVSNRSLVKGIFPENVIISFTSSEILPSTYIENGRQVLELKPEGDEIDFLCEYRFAEQIPAIVNETKNETKKPEPETQEEPEKDNDALIIVTIIITLIILAVAIYHFKKPKKSRKVKSSILGVLDENEREVVELLQSKDAEITQAYIHKTTGMPKATLSKVMRRLEERNIVERRTKGRTNWVRLKEDVFE
ncbi:MAG: hypothetical protein A7316_11100 [Candidatus Altiarchaeales archaeon WOR_SM1_86-2]|nr:MAG: hypothetical protein A7316_11100 [Candidatus Altiarchaeales archaeon WOR_SM1_86-2]